MANAVGAVTGKVTIRATATIRPETDGGFRWFTPSGPGFDEELRGAEQAARESLVRYLRERAAAYGTDERHVKLVSRDRSARLSDGSDFLIALHVEGTLEGAPRLAGIEAVDRA